MPRKKPSSGFRNRLLSRMSHDDLALLKADLQPVAFDRGKGLEVADRKIETVYFPEQGIASVVGGGKNGNREVEIGIIGFEGVTALPIIYGDDRSPYQTFVQVPGAAHRLPANILRVAMDKSASLRPLLLKYAQCFMIQSTNTAIANARGTIEERLARWVLMAQDRIEKSDLALTHEFLSMMLSVRRPGVTEALHALGQRGLIRHDRGNITVVDRDGLIERAGALYGVPESEYKRLLG